MGERYKTITKETSGVLKGEYGKTPAPVNTELQARVLAGAAAITCRPADLIAAEMPTLQDRVLQQAKEQHITLAENAIDDVLTIALFDQVGWKFLANRHNPAAFEPAPQAISPASTPKTPTEKSKVQPVENHGVYTITVNNQSYVVKVDEGGDLTHVAPAPSASHAPVPSAAEGENLAAPLSGNIWKIHASAGDEVAEGDVLLILEAMKMETEIRAPRAGVISAIEVNEGDAVQVGDALLVLA